MKQEIKFMAQLYAFGSCLVKSTFNDIDILIVYDKNQIHPQYANQLFKPLIDNLQSDFTIPLHVIILNQDEEKEVSFVKGNNAYFVSNVTINNIGKEIASKIKNLICVKSKNSDFS